MKRYKQDCSHLKPKIYDGTVVGRYSDAQSRMLLEILIVVDRVERIIKKQEHQLGFNVKIGQKVLVEFVPTRSGIIIAVKQHPSPFV